MKKIKRLLPLLMILLLLPSMVPFSALAQEGASNDPPETTPTATPDDAVFSGGIPDETSPPAETAAPTDTPVPTPTPTGTPTPTVPTQIPEEASTPAPEIMPPGMSGPSMDEPYGDGIVMGPNNPPEDGPVMFSAISGTAAIAVHNCYDSTGAQIKYASSFYWNGKYIGGYSSPRYQITANGSPAYCIEPGGYLPGGSTVSTSTAKVWNGFSSDKRNAIKVALLCGEAGNSSNLSGNFGSRYTATQMIIWELVIGARSTYSPYNCTDTKVINSVCNGGANSEVKAVYDQISNAMRTYSVLPSFVNSLNAPPPSSEMTYQNGAFTITFTDSNNVLSNFNFTSSNGNLRFSVSGNQLTITSPSTVDDATVNVTKKNAASVSSTITAYAGNGLQETIVGIEAADNTSGWFSVYAEASPPPPPAKATLTIKKTAEDGNIYNIYFTIDGIGGTVADKHYNVYTDYSGTITQELDPGTYMVTEQTPSGYVASPRSKQITLQSGDAQTISFYNSLEKGSLTINKTSDDGKVSGISFTISGNSVYKTVTTDYYGSITVSDLPPGSYTITEQVPAGYSADKASQRITLMPGEAYTVNFHNSPQKGSLKIIKTSNDNKVSGITFTVKGGSVNTNVTTESDGTITVSDLTPGSYTVTETVPSGYTADRASQTVTVEYGKTATVNFKNTLKTGSIKIVKTSDDGKVSGVQFTVTGGSVNQTVTTASDGTITVPGLVPGQYTVTETVPEGYVCDAPSQTVTVVYDQTATVNFTNKLKMWRVAVTKVDADASVRRSRNVTLEGAQYGVYKDGAIQDTYTTDSGGHFTTNYYPCGTGWTLQEIVAPTGYTVDPNSYPIGLEAGTVQLAANDTELTVPEEIIEGKLVIVKQDGLTDAPLAGAMFTVYDEDGATVTEGPTGEDGTFTVDSLPYGSYTVKEMKAPDGYQLDETVFDFAIETDGQTVTLTRENVYCVGSLTVHKQDTQGSALSGTVYLLEYSQDGATWNPVTFRSDATPTIGGCTSLDLNAGQLATGADGTVFYDGLVADGKVQYRLTEIKAPEGLSLLKDPVFKGTLPFEAPTGPEYDISFTVTNNRITTLPQTGSSGLLLPVTIGAALLGLAGCTGFFVAHNRKKHKSL